jgi:hypothetical protein
MFETIFTVVVVLVGVAAILFTVNEVTHGGVFGKTTNSFFPSFQSAAAEQYGGGYHGWNPSYNLGNANLYRATSNSYQGLVNDQQKGHLVDKTVLAARTKNAWPNQTIGGTLSDWTAIVDDPTGVVKPEDIGGLLPFNLQKLTTNNTPLGAQHMFGISIQNGNNMLRDPRGLPITAKELNMYNPRPQLKDTPFNYASKRLINTEVPYFSESEGLGEPDTAPLGPYANKSLTGEDVKDTTVNSLYQSMGIKD